MKYNGSNPENKGKKDAENKVRAVFQNYQILEVNNNNNQDSQEVNDY
jgi:hypothetical protein